ncbi:MAG: 4-hydroxy-3-methylbut-2-enyl diphosphate reductase, partial [Treponemataceae bacterium]|nr:4-hydroxy-3-methylbut-2-enyl diphosphate reductase [Treponemataceae bacterium]
DTICPATQNRQKALRDLAEKSNAIIVVGGKKSANSRRLFELARVLCERSFFVENAQEAAQLLKKGELCGAATVGITAGASTPDFLIEEVERALCRA